MKRDSAASIQERTIVQPMVAQLRFSAIKNNFEDLGV